MSTTRCSVCGSTALRLVHGTYYCKECGTQDVNVQEAVIDHVIYADETFGFVGRRKFTTIVNDGIEMSGEWYKWHAYNFILQGLADELLKLGAKPSFKMKLIWVWVRYIKAFQNEAQLGLNEENSEQKASKSLSPEEADLEDEADDGKKEENMKTMNERNSSDVKVFTKEILLGLIYAALNLDGSDIQLSHLFKFIREGKFSFYDCLKFVPKEIQTKLITICYSFVHGLSCGFITPQKIRKYAMSLFKVLKLGIPLVPDLRRMVENFVKELCLPDYIKELVFSLMYLVPCNFLVLDQHLIKNQFLIPDYEGHVMAYVLIAIKMVFGLDDDYEVRLSDAVERYNETNDIPKSCKLGGYLDKSNRLFSFREWCNYYKYRKLILSKYNFSIAQQFFFDANDCVLMDYLEHQDKKNASLLDKITMDILDKIPQMDDDSAIPKSEFVTTLTPLHTYTEVVTQYITDPELKLLLSEDFRQYSMDYLKLNLNVDEESFSNGVSMNKKIKSKTIVGHLLPSSNSCDESMVFVRNCENRNWLKKKPPSTSHIKRIEKDDENSSIVDKDSDYGYDSNHENTVVDDKSIISVESDSENNCDRKLETIDEENEDVLIFDGKLDDLKEVVDIEEPIQEQDSFFLNVENTRNEETQYNDSKCSTIIIPQFNPITFDKEKAIKELVLSECKKYKIPVPKEYKDEIVSRKRKPKLLDDEANTSEPKKQKTRANPGVHQHEIDTIIASYFSAKQSDMMKEVSEHAKSVFEALENRVPNIDVSHTSERDEHIRSVNHNNQSSFMLVDNSVNDVNDEPEEENDLQDIISKDDPNFDEKMYDIKQLYVRFKEEIHIGDISGIEDDLEVEKLIDAKIDQLDNILNGTTEKLDAPTIATDLSVELNKVSDTDSDLHVDVPSSVIQNQLLKANEKLKVPLLKNATHLNHYNYWFRHYTINHIVKCAELHKPFNLELLKNYPNSFTFVIRECASIVECTPFAIYKHLQRLEPVLLNKFQKDKYPYRIKCIIKKTPPAKSRLGKKGIATKTGSALPTSNGVSQPKTSPAKSRPRKKGIATKTGSALPTSNGVSQPKTPPAKSRPGKKGITTKAGPALPTSNGVSQPKTSSAKSRPRKKGIATKTGSALPTSNGVSQPKTPPAKSRPRKKGIATKTGPALPTSNGVSQPKTSPAKSRPRKKGIATKTGPALPTSNGVSQPKTSPAKSRPRKKGIATKTGPALPTSNGVSQPKTLPAKSRPRKKGIATKNGPSLPTSNGVPQPSPSSSSHSLTASDRLLQGPLPQSDYFCCVGAPQRPVLASRNLHEVPVPIGAMEPCPAPSHQDIFEIKVPWEHY